jgi:hypothetical protein
MVASLVSRGQMHLVILIDPFNFLGYHDGTKLTILCGVTPYSLVHVFGNFTENCASNFGAEERRAEVSYFKLEAAVSFEMLVPTYQTTRCHISEDLCVTAMCELDTLLNMANFWSYRKYCSKKEIFTGGCKQYPTRIINGVTA